MLRQNRVYPEALNGQGNHILSSKQQRIPLLGYSYYQKGLKTLPLPGDCQHKDFISFLMPSYPGRGDGHYAEAVAHDMELPKLTGKRPVRTFEDPYRMMKRRKMDYSVRRGEAPVMPINIHGDASLTNARMFNIGDGADIHGSVLTGPNSHKKPDPHGDLKLGDGFGSSLKRFYHGMNKVGFDFWGGVARYTGLASAAELGADAAIGTARMLGEGTREAGKAVIKVGTKAASQVIADSASHIIKQRYGGSLGSTGLGNKRYPNHDKPSQLIHMSKMPRPGTPGGGTIVQTGQRNEPAATTGHRGNSFHRGGGFVGDVANAFSEGFHGVKPPSLATQEHPNPTYFSPYYDNPGSYGNMLR